MANSQKKEAKTADSGAHALFLRTLGHLALSDESGQPVKLRTRKALLLLACLASDPDRTWPRERLASLLWGDRQDEQARNSLRTALSDIRRVAGDDALDVEGTTIRLKNTAVSTDLDRLRRLESSEEFVDAGPLETIYGGDFLADSGDAVDSPEWLGEMRSRVRDMAVSVMERTVDGLASAGRLEQAIRRARDLLSLDPLREASHRRLMRLYADSGERSKAIAQYQSCRQLLQRELSVEPSDETRHLADEIAVLGEAALSTLKTIAEEPIEVSLNLIGSSGHGSISIGVLPFVNMSGDAEQDYFAEGITEDITIDLSKIDDLSVAAPGSTRMYRTTMLSPTRIAAEIGVDYVLTGSVRRSDKMVRIATSLVDGRSNRQIWGERYDRELVNIFDVQTDIAASVASAVRSTVSPATIAQAAVRGTASLEAHEQYLRGRALLKEMSRRSVELSKSSFERAIAADRQYALAYAGLAESITMLGWHYEAALPLLDQAREHCQTALRLDPGLAEAHCSLGRFHSAYLRFEEAEAAFDRAIEISPTLSEAYLYRALMRLTVGRADDAIAPLRRAFELAKQDLHPGMMLMTCQDAIGLHDEQKATAEWVWSVAQRRISLNPYDDQAAYVGAFALNYLGNRQDAIRWANVAAAFGIEDPRSTYNIACLFSVLGDVDQALHFLRKTLALGVPQVKRNWIRYHDPDWKQLRDASRFLAVFQEV
jgi:TolB-like protein/DNA-binding SARP family transcriptional activator/Flp pilus assembly protein TadD